MADPAVGMILAAIDTDVDNLEAWNRWYDLEHLAPNIALPGVITGRRYVAPPGLHTERVCAEADPAWGDGRAVFLTWYATAVDPREAIGAMAALRDELEAEGRMDGAGKRVVRTGDALHLTSAWSDPHRRLVADELIHVEHLGLRLVLDRADRDAAGGPHVVASFRFESVFHPSLRAELQFLIEPASTTLNMVRRAEPVRDSIVLDAGFDVIHGLRYPFIAEIETSSLPRSIDA